MCAWGRRGRGTSRLRLQEEPVHTFTVSFGGLDPSFGAISEFDSRVGHHCVALLRHGRRQSWCKADMGSTREARRAGM